MLNRAAVPSQELLEALIEPQYAEGRGGEEKGRCE
jgi:hypothetical protein